jgi:hypothetical protein
MQRSGQIMMLESEASNLKAACGLSIVFCQLLATSITSRQGLDNNFAQLLLVGRAWHGWRYNS